MNPKIEIKICIKIGNLKNQESKLIRDFDQEFSYKKFMLSKFKKVVDKNRQRWYYKKVPIRKNKYFIKLVIKKQAITYNKI